MIRLGREHTHAGTTLPGALVTAACALSLLACGSSHPDADAGGDLADAGAPSDAGPVEEPDGGATPDAGSPTDGGTDARPRVHVHLRSTHEPVAHAAGTAGQTPRDWRSGVRSLHLLRTIDDPSPMLVFDHGDGFVEASYADGADTIVGSAPLEALTPGTYTYARVVHTHVRFTIDATSHGGFGPVPGELEEDQRFWFEVNVHEGFRWTDVTAAGYQTDVFDVSAAGPEPIVQAGANAYAYALD